jgi:hypothetical protein
MLSITPGHHDDQLKIILFSFSSKEWISDILSFGELFLVQGVATYYYDH